MMTSNKHPPNSKVHGANTGPTWVLSAPCWPHEPCYLGPLSLYLYHLSLIEHSVLCGLYADLKGMINSSPPSAAYMRRWTGPSLVQVMACRLFSAKPLPEPMLAYCQLDSWEQIFSEIIIEILSFSFKKMHLKMPSAKMTAILSRGRWVNSSPLSATNIFVSESGWDCFRLWLVA